MTEPPKGKTVNPTAVAVLGTVTLFFSILFWAWARSREMNDYLGRKAVNRALFFPGALLILIPPIFGAHQMARAIPEMQKKAGLPVEEEFVGHFLSLSFASPIGAWLIQKRLNEIWRKETGKE